jgi:hypothetical protein
MTHLAPMDFWIICCVLALMVFGVICMSAWKGNRDE